MARPRRNTAAAAAKVDTAETVQAVKEESAVCAAGEKGAVSAAGQKKTACVAEEKNDAGVVEENTTHEAGRTVIVEFAGKQIMAKDVLQKAEEAYLAAHKDVEIKTLELYISPEQNAAYYVVNGEGGDDFKVML